MNDVKKKFIKSFKDMSEYSIQTFGDNIFKFNIFKFRGDDKDIVLKSGSIFAYKEIIKNKAVNYNLIDTKPINIAAFYELLTAIFRKHPDTARLFFFPYQVISPVFAYWPIPYCSSTNEVVIQIDIFLSNKAKEKLHKI